MKENCLRVSFFCMALWWPLFALGSSNQTDQYFPIDEDYRYTSSELSYNDLAQAIDSRIQSASSVTVTSVNISLGVALANLVGVFDSSGEDYVPIFGVDFTFDASIELKEENSALLYTFTCMMIEERDTPSPEGDTVEFRIEECEGKNNIGGPIVKLKEFLIPGEDLGITRKRVVTIQ